MSKRRYARIIAVANQKGGVGKTTTCVNLGAALVNEGKKVLLLDNDPQANLTSYLQPKGSAKGTVDEIYLSKKLLDYDQAKSSYIQNYLVSFDYIAGSKELAGVEFYLFSKPDRELILRKNLEWARSEYDFIIIDNPPSMNLLTLNALCAADEVLIPLQTEFFSLEGIAKMQETIALIKERWNPTLRVAGLLPTQIDLRKKLTQEVLKTLESHFPKETLKTRIRENIKLSESSGHGQTIFKYAPRSPGAEDYSSLASELCAN